MIEKMNENIFETNLNLMYVGTFHHPWIETVTW